MKTLSIRQPWASLIVAGLKDIENRTWETRFRGPLLIHAGKSRPSKDEIASIEEEFDLSINVDALPYGGIIGACKVVDCVDTHKSRWFFGDYGFVLADARAIDFVPCTGKLGLFNFELPQELSKCPSVDVSVLFKSKLVQKFLPIIG
ncbi:MAG: hypothetical protein JWM68_245 [Verrucomicrobiales bacterium]|nr:hypothetical protein [Verrucomicrobiales bacterium]